MLLRRTTSGRLARFFFWACAGLLPIAAAGQTAPSSPSTTDLRVSTIERPARTQATFTVHVAAEQDGATTPTGSVTFMDGDKAVGSAFLDEQGEATLTVDALPLGEQKLTAVYEGDASHKASISEPAVVNSAASGVPAFTLGASTTSLKTAAGTTATTVITATPENGFSQAVSLSCSGVPYASVTCVFSPAQVTPGAPTAAAPNGIPASSTLSINTIAPSGGALIPGPATWRSSQTAYALLLPGILALAGLGLTRKQGFRGKAGASVKMLGLLCLLLAGSAGLSACNARYGYYHHPPAYNPGTPPGTYTVTVSGITGTGSTLTTATVQLTLAVK